jgi:glycosyltransferase involved in cell wall biosynthesis
VRICVVTSHELGEPRGPRHAVAVKRAFPDAEVIFLHYQSGSATMTATAQLLQKEHNIACRVLTFPTRASAPIELLRRKLTTRLGRAVYQATGIISQSIFAERTINLTHVLSHTAADVYFAHNFEALLPAAVAARRHGAALLFDCMEFYSDIGDGQRADVSRAVAEIEARYLPGCRLVVAASEELAVAYASAYGIARPLAAYNVPPVVDKLPPKKGGGLNLYWRNNVLGFGQRGLDDVLEAMTRLPPDVHLHLQGTLGHDGGGALRRRIADLGIDDKVTILPPHPPDGAVQSAAPYDVGLCLERKGPRNHDLTVSNKMFDYHMAGLAVIASDLPGLAGVIRSSGGGILYEPGKVSHLCAAIQSFRSQPDRLAQHQSSAGGYALREGNIEVAIARVAEGLKFALARAPDL